MLELTRAQMRVIMGSGTNDPPGDTEGPITDIDQIIIKGRGGNWMIIDDPMAIEEILGLGAQEFVDLYEAMVVVPPDVDPATNAAILTLIGNGQFNEFSVTVQKLILSSPLITEILAAYFKLPDGSTRQLYNNPGQFDGTYISVLLDSFKSNDINVALNAVMSLAHELGHFANMSLFPNDTAPDVNYVYDRAKYEVVATAAAMNWISQMVQGDLSLANYITISLIPYVHNSSQYQAMKDGQMYMLSGGELDALVKTLLGRPAGTGAGPSPIDWDGVDGFNYIERYLSDKHRQSSFSEQERKTIYDNVKNSLGI